MNSDSLHFEDVVVALPADLVLFVPKEYVYASRELEGLRRNRDHIAIPYPVSSLEYARYSAEALFALLAVHHDSVATEHFHCYA